MISESIKYELVTNKDCFSLLSENHLIGIKVIRGFREEYLSLIEYDNFLLSKFNYNDIIPFYFDLSNGIHFKYLFRSGEIQDLVSDLKTDHDFKLLKLNIQQEILSYAEWLMSPDCREYIERLKKLEIYL